MPASTNHTFLPISLFNTLSGKRERFVSVRPGEISMYVCGVTVYDRCHLGHLRAALNFDTIRKFLTYAGYRVTFVKNYTDIDDKIIQRAAEKQTGFRDLTAEMIALHDADMKRFEICQPDMAPKASEHIEVMIDLIKNLESKGFAYQSGGDVMFATDNYANYGQLSKKNTDDLDAGHRVKVQEEKRNPHDFVLWKAAKPGEPFWESPWGIGRPGWHIECSAMARHYLGDVFDIHGGGSDLIFPHHENEIAQSAACTGKIPARYWLHNGMITLEQNKMSKSVGNIILPDELAKMYRPEIIRLFFLKTHYRQTLNFTYEGLDETAENLDRFYHALLRVHSHREALPEIPVIEDAFTEAMGTDFNTPAALAVLHQMTTRLNDAPAEADETKALAKRLLEYGRLFGILGADPEEWFSSPRKNTDVSKGLSNADIQALVNERTAARKQKDWKRSDEIRDRLTQLGITIKDNDKETIWYFS